MRADRVSFDDEAPASRITWLRAHLTRLERIPAPGAGLTVQRWRALAELAAADGSLACLADSHLEALALLDELGGGADGAEHLRAVWAASPDALHAEPEPGGWHLVGRAPQCRGAAGIDRALVSAIDPCGAVRLFDVDVATVEFVDDWDSPGLRAVDARTARLDVHLSGDRALGGPDAYTARAGFWHSSIGAAACTHGLARRVGRHLAEEVARRDDRSTRAASGRATAALAASSTLLAAAGRQIDEQPHDAAAARRRAHVVRVAVEQSARTVLETAVDIHGRGVACRDARHVRAVADLTSCLADLQLGHDAAAVEVHASDDWWSS